MIMVAAGKCRQLGHGRAAELAAPDHQHLVEEPALLEVRQKSGNGLVPFRGELAVMSNDVLVVVPRLTRATPYLNESHPALEQAASDQELPRLRARPVQSTNRFGLAADIKGFGGLALHAVSQLERLDPRLERRIVRASRRMPLVQLREPGRAAAVALADVDASLRMFSISFSISVCLVSMYVP